mmetsp:Transcript_76354/g.233653  ORF Transcript_76354/g.233653 Transcript_76354/m.233653 type:complete len:227 (-) Transcript_76354:898-1578(-)
MLARKPAASLVPTVVSNRDKSEDNSAAACRSSLTQALYRFTGLLASGPFSNCFNASSSSSNLRTRRSSISLRWLFVRAKASSAKLKSAAAASTARPTAKPSGSAERGQRAPSPCSSSATRDNVSRPRATSPLAATLKALHSRSCNRLDSVPDPNASNAIAFERPTPEAVSVGKAFVSNWSSFRTMVFCKLSWFSSQLSSALSDTRAADKNSAVFWAWAASFSSFAA